MEPQEASTPGFWAIALPLIYVAFGFALSFGGTWIRDLITAKYKKKSLATALLVEIVSQAHWCARHGNQWNVHSMSPRKLSMVGLARKHRPPAAYVYGSIVHKIDVLAARDVSRVIAFHGAVDTVRSRIDSWSEERETNTISHDGLIDLAAKWRAACFQAILAIRALEPIAKVPQLPNDKEEMTRLLNDLQTVADGRVIQFENDESRLPGAKSQ